VPDDVSNNAVPDVQAAFDAAAFGSRIKRLRTLRKLSLEEVGQAAGFTKSHIWAFETGRSRNPTVRAVWSLAKALGVTPAHILGLSPDGLSLHPTAMEVACIVDRALAQQAEGARHV
jgi:transcriptional regulator with XRE-family HTH domain